MRRLSTIRTLQTRKRSLLVLSPMKDRGLLLCLEVGYFRNRGLSEATAASM